MSNRSGITIAHARPARGPTPRATDGAIDRAGASAEASSARRSEPTLEQLRRGASGDAEEEANANSRWRFATASGRVGHHRPGEQRGFACHPGHDRLGDLDVARGDGEAHRGDGLVGGAGGDPGPALQPERLVDAHEVLPRQDLVGRGLVGRVDRAGDGAQVLGTEPAQHLDEGLQLHTQCNGPIAAES